MHTQTNPSRIEEIRHLLGEIRRIQAESGSCSDATHEEVTRELIEISDTLHSKLKATKYFRKDWLYFKYLTVQQIEVVFTPHAISIEPEALYESEICDQQEYFDAIFAVLEGEEVCRG